ncbi:MAG: alginate export family protein [Gemmatimonadaceae bacterium]|nr:alginate export family protein [Gemmatimonadaceae bacterium]
MLTATRWACTLLLVVAVPALAQSSQAPAAASRTTATSATTASVSTVPVANTSPSAAPQESGRRRLAQWDEAIKDIPLAGERPITLTIGGQARWREEFFRAFNTGELDDDHGQSRILISADLQVGERTGRYARLFAEGRDAQSYGRSLPGGARPNDADRSDVQNLWIDLGSNKSYLRVGRQEISLAAQRLFGVPDWSNTRRGSQGVRLYTEHGRFAFEGIQARPMVVRQYARNHADTTQQFRTLSLGSAAGAAPLWRGLPATWQAYWYEQQIESASAPVRRLTTGGRLMWDWGKKSALARSLEFEGAKQGGAIGARRLDGWFWVGEATVRWTRLRGAPSLAIGIEEASGENRATANRQEAFAVLYPAAHAHGGYADVIGRTNVRELHLFSTWSPVRSVNLRFAAYRFDRLRLDDGVWTKQNSVFRAASGSTARHAADELDLTGVWKATTHTQVIFGGALVLPGAFLRNTPGGARTERWGFVGTAFTF